MIAVTAWTQPSDRILAKLAGFDHHVAKPYEPNALLALVSDLAARS
jgi:CheY-like chemotaxis protein